MNECDIVRQTVLNECTFFPDPALVKALAPPKKRKPRRKVTACDHEQKLFMFSSRDKVVKKLLAILEPRKDEFDALVVSGYSMALIAPILAHRLHKNIVLVRKPEEAASCHSWHTVEGGHSQRCVMVDDLICSGQTLERIGMQLNKLQCCLVGFVLYCDASYEKGDHYDGVSCWGSV